MWIRNEIIKEDLEQTISLKYIPWEKLKGKTILVTGATGLIGQNIINILLFLNIRYTLNIRILALVRNKEKAKMKFAEQLRGTKALGFIEGIVENLPEIDEEIHYIIHGASPTASAYFVEKPVETIQTMVVGTINVLELARRKDIKGVVYLSSMEVYGLSELEKMLTEKDLGYLDPLVIRNCYPESKRQCEALCAAYASEYAIPAMGVRLAQTFGPGVGKNDARVFAEFARNAMKGEDIVLLTDGSSKRCYLYTADAVSAILTVLLKGNAGVSYNVGNPETYCSIYEMAVMVAEKVAKKKINIRRLNRKEENYKYLSPHFYYLAIDKISNLGWHPTKNLEEMFNRMIESEYFEEKCTYNY